jgi:hypothetical protein
MSPREKGIAGLRRPWRSPKIKGRLSADNFYYSEYTAAYAKAHVVDLGLIAIHAVPGEVAKQNIPKPRQI